MNFNLVEMYNGLLRFNKHILNELAEGLKHLPNLDGVSIGGNKNSSVAATKLQGRPRTGISYDKANEFCVNRGDWITMIDYLEYYAIQALCYIEYANFDNQAALNTNLTSEGFKQAGLGAGVT